MRHVLLYDGECGLCSRAVRFVLTHDDAGAFSFARLQGEPGRALAGGAPRMDTFIVVTADGRRLERSDAALEVARHLGWPWRALLLLRAVPRPVRDGAYDVVARNRHRLGLPPSCALPGPRWRERSLDQD